jgi:hypothetical protein
VKTVFQRRDKVEFDSKPTSSKSGENTEVIPLVQNDQHFTVRVTVEELNINRVTVELNINRVTVEELNINRGTVQLVIDTHTHTHTHAHTKKKIMVLDHQSTDLVLCDFPSSPQ